MSRKTTPEGRNFNAKNNPDRHPRHSSGVGRPYLPATGSVLRGGSAKNIRETNSNAKKNIIGVLLAAVAAAICVAIDELLKEEKE